MCRILVVTFFIFCFVLGNCKAKKTISVKDFKTILNEYNLTNYNLLKGIHEEAITNNLRLDYSGVDTIRLEIPINATPISIPHTINFKNTVFLIRNNNKDVSVFEYTNPLISIKLDKCLFTKDRLLNIKEFKTRKILLISEDQNPWVKERKGYKISHFRKDLFIIEDGFRLNDPIKAIDNSYSDPTFSYCDVTNNSIRVENLKFIRTDDSTHKTFCLHIQNANDVNINNIYIETPNSPLYGDAILSFINCANLRLQNISINGTYSQRDKYGYGFSMNNIYNCHMKNIYGTGNWGVFGTNNVNNVRIEDCDLNRFDIHCYGKDVYCSNTKFKNLYNQFSSFYGKLIYKKCQFFNFVPITIDGSYSAYTSFDVIFDNCDIILDSKRPFIFNMTTSKFLIDSIRPEMMSFEWPNVIINNTRVNCTEYIKTMYLFHTYKPGIIDLNKKFHLDIHNNNFNNIDLKISNSTLNFID